MYEMQGRYGGSSSSTLDVPRTDMGSVSGALLTHAVKDDSSLWSGVFPMWRRGSVSIEFSGSQALEDRVPKQERRKTDAELVRSLRERSGLTWEILAKTLGVSRRSLHMWAAGATVTPAHRSVMNRFEELLDSFGPLSPAETKAKLFESPAVGKAPIDQFRMTRDGSKRDINGPVLNAYQMM